MARGDTLGFNAALIRQNALEEAGGDPDLALTYVSQAAAEWYACKGAGYDREGARVRNPDWSPKLPPEPILTKDGQ